MKRLFLFITSLLTISVFSFAQTKVNSGSSEIDITVKRAFARGNEVCVDLIITNNSNWESISFNLWDSKVYDDEGNEYTKNSLSKEGPSTYGGKIDIPREVPRKVRLVVAKVDEYASSFTLMKIEYEGWNPSSNPRTLTIKNLPIARE